MHGLLTHNPDTLASVEARRSRRCAGHPAGRQVRPKLLVTQHFKLEAIGDAYETFAHAASTRALKVIIEA